VLAHSQTRYHSAYHVRLTLFHVWCGISITTSKNFNNIMLLAGSWLEWWCQHNRQTAAVQHACSLPWLQRLLLLLLRFCSTHWHCQSRGLSHEVRRRIMTEGHLNLSTYTCCVQMRCQRPEAVDSALALTIINNV
jgi:hypothetical protein